MHTTTDQWAWAYSLDVLRLANATGGRSSFLSYDTIREPLHSQFFGESLRVLRKHDTHMYLIHKNKMCEGSIWNYVFVVYV